MGYACYRQGIRSEDIDRVLLRATSRSATEELSGIPRSNARYASASTKPACTEISLHGADTGITSNPIVIEDDVDDGALIQGNSVGLRGVVPSSSALQDRTATPYDTEARTDISNRPALSLGTRGGNERRFVPSPSCSRSMT